MSKTKGNQLVLAEVRRTAEVLPFLYEKREYKEINNELEIFMSKAEELDKIPKKYANWTEQDYLTFSLGNKKIGKDTLCISLTAGVFCPMGLTGNCGNCSICYAVNQNKMYFKNTVPKNCINQILVNKVLLGEKGVYEVISATIAQIKKDLSKKELANLKYLRLNVEGDILDNKVLTFANMLSRDIKTEFNLISVYSYTHNQELDLEYAPSINFNLSDFEGDNNSTCRTVFEITAELREKILAGDSLLCAGDCSCCSYCKDENHNKDIIFIAHGGKYKGVAELETADKELWDFICNKRDIDCELFELLENWADC